MVAPIYLGIFDGGGIHVVDGLNQLIVYLISILIQSELQESTVLRK